MHVIKQVKWWLWNGESVQKDAAKLSEEVTVAFENLDKRVDYLKQLVSRIQKGQREDGNDRIHMA